MLKKNYLCPHCGTKLEKSVISAYEFYCPECDEDFYKFEAIVETSRKEVNNHLPKPKKMTKAEREKYLKKEYQKYQLKWMAEHGYSIDDLLKICLEIILEGYEEYPRDFFAEFNGNADSLVTATLTAFEKTGFQGELYACFDEWLEYEGKDL